MCKRRLIRPVTPVLTAVLALLAVAAAGCQAAPPADRGRQSSHRMDPGRDAPSEYGGVLGSADLVAATDLMARDIATDLDVTNRASPPRIVVGAVDNRTSMPQQNYQIFLNRLRAQLMESGARHGLEFIRDRRWVQQQRDREYGAQPDQFEQRADYVLTCEVWDMPSGGSQYYLLDYQLVQLRDAATGPDLGPGAIVWENKYEVKFQ